MKRSWNEFARPLLAEGELIIAPLARLASFEVPLSHCPSQCASLLMKRFPAAPWDVGLERIDRKGEAIMRQSSHLAEQLLEPVVNLLSRTSTFQERALDALRRFSRDAAVISSPNGFGDDDELVELFMDLFCLLFRTHLLASSSPRALVLQVHAYAYAVNRGFRCGNGHSGDGAVARGNDEGGVFTAMTSNSSSPSEPQQPRLHPAYSHLVACIKTYASPVPQLQRECHAFGAVVCDALDGVVLPTFSVVTASRIFSGTRTDGVQAPPQRRGRRRRMRRRRDDDDDDDYDDDDALLVSNVGADKATLEGLSGLDRHLEWILWGFLCFPDLCCRSVARSDALKYALTNTLVQPLAGDRWVKVHPLFLHHASHIMHAFGKSLERASKDRAKEIICLPPGLDARKYKRRLRGLVEDARLAASSGSAANHHAERRMYVAHECSALAVYLDGEAAAASMTTRSCFGGWTNNGDSAMLTVTPMVVPVRLITAVLSAAHAELRWLLHHAVAETVNNDKRLSDVVVAPALTSLVGGGSTLRDAVRSLSPWFNAAAAGAAADRARFQTVRRDSDCGVLLRTFPGRTSALVLFSLAPTDDSGTTRVETALAGHLAAVISNLTSSPEKREKEEDDDEDKRLGRATAVAATKWANEVIATAAESCTNDIVNRVTAARIPSTEAVVSKDLSTKKTASASSSSSWGKSLIRSFGGASSKRSAAATLGSACANADRLQLRVARRRLVTLVATADALARRDSERREANDLSGALRQRLVNGVIVNQVGGVHSSGRHREEQVAEIMQAAGIKGAASFCAAQRRGCFSVVQT